jgi:hypothetical protein
VSFSDEMTLGEARDELRELVERGHECPCCRQFAKIYRRKLPVATCRVMIELYRLGAWDEYVYLLNVLDEMTGIAHQGGYVTMAHWWRLMEQQPGEREDGSDHVGWWRLTPLGVQFVRGEATVPKYARLYDGRRMGLSGEPVTISDCLGHRFDYGELMAGV